MIAAVLNHPDLPNEIHNGIGRGFDNILNGLSGESQREVEDTPEYIGAVLRVYAEEKGGAK